MLASVMIYILMRLIQNGLKLGSTDIQFKTLFRLGEIQAIEEATALFYHPSSVLIQYVLGAELQRRSEMP